VLAQGVIDFLKHGLRGGAGRRKGLTHANGLTALARKDECAHECSLSDMFAAA